jgi:ABC-type glycerol-3-phosphate transport system permease component
VRADRRRHAHPDPLEDHPAAGRPGLISAGIFAFTLSWNEFIYALAFISSTEQKTVPVGVLTELVEGDVYHWGSLMAGAPAGLAAGRDLLFVLRRALRLLPDRRGQE